MSKPIRVLIPVDSHDPEAVSLALGYAQEIAKMKGLSEVLLITHTKGQLDHTSLERDLGRAASKALSAGKTVSLSTGATLRYGTLATLRHFSGKAVAIAYYVDEKLVDFVDGLRGIEGVIAVPWVPGELDNWRERWNPIVHGEAKKEPTDILNDPVVETALRSVSTIINLSHSVLQTRDEAWVDDTLRILRAKGHALDGQKLKNWAIRNGWKPGAANDLAKRAQKIGHMKTKPRLSAIANANDRYARWKSGES